MRTTFRMEDMNISMVRGDTLAFGIELYEEGENDELVAFTQDLDSAYFTCTKTFDDNVFQKSLEDGITKLEDGQYVVRIAPEDTENLEPGKYFYDFEVGVNSDKFTILKGVLEIERDVTN